MTAAEATRARAAEAARAADVAEKRTRQAAAALQRHAAGMAAITH